MDVIPHAAAGIPLKVAITSLTQNSTQARMFLWTLMLGLDTRYPSSNGGWSRWTRNWLTESQRFDIVYVVIWVAYFASVLFTYLGSVWGISVYWFALHSSAARSIYLICMSMSYPGKLGILSHLLSFEGVLYSVIVKLNFLPSFDAYVLLLLENSFTRIQDTLKSTIVRRKPS